MHTCCTPVLSLLVNYVQILVSRKTLLQDHCYKDGGSRVKALALDNRRVYHNFSYFLFFFNILLGFYSCLLRIVKGILLGLVFLARVDLSSLMQGYQHWDFGYMSYVSFLHVEHAHCHPVLVTFCRLLLQGNSARRRHCTPAEEEQLLADDQLTEMEQGAVPTPVHRARLRWWKVYTLLRNPQLQRPLAAGTGRTAGHQAEVLRKPWTQN
ncbi:stimulated by retinoic acid gene 6 protein-like [Branchiostoma floridae x Branchiostoma japonicum]